MDIPQVISMPLLPVSWDEPLKNFSSFHGLYEWFSSSWPSCHGLTVGAPIQRRNEVSSVVLRSISGMCSYLEISEFRSQMYEIITNILGVRDHPSQKRTSVSSQK